MNCYMWRERLKGFTFGKFSLGRSYLKVGRHLTVIFMSCGSTSHSSTVIFCQASLHTMFTCICIFVFVFVFTFEFVFVFFDCNHLPADRKFVFLSEIGVLLYEHLGKDGRLRAH